MASPPGSEPAAERTPKGPSRTGSAQRSPRTMRSPRSANEAQRLHERELHRAEVSLSAKAGELVEVSRKLTQTNVELQLTRSQLDSRSRDLAYTRRLLDKSRQQQTALVADADTAKEELKRLNRGMGPAADAAAVNERFTRLASRLEEEEDTARTQKREVRRLRDDISALKEALKMRGEAGALQEELIQVRTERMQLAIELHDCKETTRRAEEESEMSRTARVEAASEMTSLRDELEVIEEQRAGEARELLSKLEQGAGQVGALRKSEADLRRVAGELRAELSSTAAQLEATEGQKEVLIQERQQAEALIGQLQSELNRRDEDFQLELGVVAEENVRARQAIRRREDDAAAALHQAGDLEAKLELARDTEMKLCEELAAASASRDSSEEESAMLRSEIEMLQEQVGGHASALQNACERLSVTEASGDAKKAALSQRLHAALHELQAAFIDRDRLSAALDEALRRCTSSLVAKQLAEDARSELQQELIAMQLHLHSSGGVPQ